jgi:tRNA/tmRNA/rRNA uracil-C5-methylase (TrmA/RlmC/RlmD family)
MALEQGSTLKIGDRIEVTIEKVAHGGHFIARHYGAVIFVRHAIPGEVCTVELTSIGKTFIRADVVSVKTPSDFRVTAPCAFSRPDGCGGCDFQHISEEYQRTLKSQVITEQFARIAKMDITVDVEKISEATKWRTRAIATTDSDGKLGFYKSRSNTVIPVTDCLICIDEIGISELSQKDLKADYRVEVSASNTGERTIALASAGAKEKARITQGPAVLHEKVLNKVLKVSHESFWQSHKMAPEVLTKAVTDFGNFRQGEHVLDLYGGVGLFTAAIVEIVGENGHVDLIEGSKSATGDASRNFALHSNVKVITGDVAKHLPRISSADVIVLDPPREGAGKEVVAQIARMRPRAIIYVACDPAALARDSAYLADHSFSLVNIRAFDLFPMTHHIECVALYAQTDVS